MAQDPIGKYRVVVIGGSAGSLEVILQFIGMLQHDAGITYILVLHRKNDADSILEKLLSTRTSMAVHEVDDKDRLDENTICIAPPDYHLLLEDQHTFSLDSSEKINFSRPSIDVTFESVAEIFGAAAIGVILSGANADGARGLKKMKEAGSFTIVQSPDSADVDYMPKQAIALCPDHLVVTANEIGKIIAGLVG